MCGRYTLTDPHSLQTCFEIVGTSDIAIVPRFNIAPTQTVPVVTASAEGRNLTTMRWGFRPAWMKDARRPPPINARAETLLETRMFRGALAKGRCIIPADGFYEWAAVPGQRTKQPMHIRLKGGELFGFAGLWTEGADGPGCAIVTTSANELVAPIHERMPVILDPADEATWLDPTEGDPLAVLPALRAYPAERMEAYSVAPLVSSVRNDGPELVRPVG